MHETSLARQLLAVVLDKAQEAQAQKIKEVHGWVAETEALSAESLSFHFAAYARGTLAEGAALHLETHHVPARCKSCLETYLPEHHLLLCPHCGGTDGELLRPTGIGLSAIEIE